MSEEDLDEAGRRLWDALYRAVALAEASRLGREQQRWVEGARADALRLRDENLNDEPDAWEETR